MPQIVGATTCNMSTVMRNRATKRGRASSHRRRAATGAEQPPAPSSHRRVQPRNSMPPGPLTKLEGDPAIGGQALRVPVRDGAIWASEDDAGRRLHATFLFAEEEHGVPLDTALDG